MRRALVVFVMLIALAGGVAAAQRQLGGFGFRPVEPRIKNPEYNGQFTFARIKYVTGIGPDYGNGYYYGGLPAWAHGFVSLRGGNRAEESLMRIMDEISFLNPRVEDDVIAGFDDPELFKYPVAYMTEPGFWTLNDEEAAGLRAYLLKGGFIIFDDFRADGQYNSGGGFENLVDNMHRALPELQPVRLDASAPIFHSFFEIPDLDIIPQSYDRGEPEFWGFYENNDPTKRLMAIVNYNTDISDFWEFSATGFRPIDESNQAYKLGVNYIMYGLTH